MKRRAHAADYCLVVLVAVAVFAHGRPQSHPSDAGSISLLLLSIVKDAADVLPSRLLELVEVACRPGINARLVVYESNSKDQTRAILEEFAQSNPSCRNAKFGDGNAGASSSAGVLPPAFVSIESVDHWKMSVDGTGVSDQEGDTILKNAEEREDKRIQRIAHLRNALRDATRPSMAGSQPPDVVMVMDLDLRKFPSILAMDHAIRRVAQGNEWSLLCANGHMGHFGREYYDLFATVLPNRTMPMQQVLQPNQTLPQRNSIKHALWEHVEHNEQPIVPMLSCFGGIGIYRAHDYFLNECSYQRERGGPYAITRFKKDTATSTFHRVGIGFQCEHVTFHMCLQNHSSQFKAGVVQELTTDWRPN
eukprot:m.267234 g.267234  ORF g.267234 m.267234 type:complete len:363 (-) comp71901_c0_seq1:61-1149(-)